MAHLPSYVDESAIYKKLVELKTKFEKYTIVGSGSYRRTYDLGNGYVAKIPHEHSLDCGSNTGISANLIEYAIYKKYSRSGIFVRTRLIWKLGFPILIMEKVARGAGPDRTYEEKIKKYKLDFDDGYYQCGKNSKGKTVCFDFGNEFDFLTIEEFKTVESKYLEIYKKYSKESLTVA